MILESLLQANHAWGNMCFTGRNDIIKLSHLDVIVTFAPEINKSSLNIYNVVDWSKVQSRRYVNYRYDQVYKIPNCIMDTYVVSVFFIFRLIYCYFVYMVRIQILWLLGVIGHVFMIIWWPPSRGELSPKPNQDWYFCRQLR